MWKNQDLTVVSSSPWRKNNKKVGSTLLTSRKKLLYYLHAGESSPFFVQISFTLCFLDKFGNRRMWKNESKVVESVTIFRSRRAPFGVIREISGVFDKKARNY